MDNIFAIDAEWKVSGLTCRRQVDCSSDAPAVPIGFGLMTSSV